MLKALAPELASCEPGYLRAEKLPHLTTVIRMGQAKSPGMFNFDDVCVFGNEKHYQRLEQLKTELRPDDAINIQFTSGTTGTPKGATLTHCNILNNGYEAGKGMALTPDDRLVGFDVEMAQYLALDLNVELEFVPFPGPSSP